VLLSLHVNKYPLNYYYYYYYYYYSGGGGGGGKQKNYCYKGFPGS
jgi:hypothetical protein